MTLDTRYQNLLQRLDGLGPAAVAFSGGVDSTLLLKAALDALGAERVLAITAASPFFPDWELRGSRDIAQRLGARQIVVKCDLLQRPEVVRNDALRCYYCKQALFGLCRDAARKQGFNLMLDGSNLDDGDDYRPGSRAAREMGVRSPLAECGLTKKDVRTLSRQLGLPTWDRPAFACLASRIPYGTAIDAEQLRQVELCETVLRELGFDGARARHHGKTVRIEIAPELFPRMLEESTRRAVVEGARAAGFAFVAMDLEGYRTGSFNETLDKTIE